MKKGWIKNFRMLNNERGSLLLISYFVISILLGIGAAYILVANHDQRMSERQRLTSVAFHIAEAGVERALYDLKLDFINDSTPSWTDGDINGYSLTNDGSYHTIAYASTVFNNGSYVVQLKTEGNNIWIQSVGTISGATQTLRAYIKMMNVSPWNNAIFAGSGASGRVINGNVNIRGGVHILGNGLNPGDYAIDLGGTAELVGNNYNNLPASLAAKVPALPTTVVNGETVHTLNAELRVKKGLVGLSGSSTVGEANVAGDNWKENVDGVYVTDGYGGNKGAINVNSDNGTSNAYDLGDTVSYPTLNDPYPGYASYDAYLKANALVLTNELNNIDPDSSFSYSSANGSITMNGNGVMTVNGIVYVDGNNNFNMDKAGSKTTITYSGTGTVVVTGSSQININLVTNGNNSYPTNVLGVLSHNDIGIGSASNIDVMGLFYASDTISVAKQTNILGTIVANNFNMGTNVPSIFQVPETVNHLPPGFTNWTTTWYLVVAWFKS